MALRRGGDLRHPLSFRDYFFLAGLSKKSLSMKDFFDVASILYYGRGRQNRTAATPTPRIPCGEEVDHQADGGAVRQGRSMLRPYRTWPGGGRGGAARRSPGAWGRPASMAPEGRSMLRPYRTRRQRRRSGQRSPRPGEMPAVRWCLAILRVAGGKHARHRRLGRRHTGRPTLRISGGVQWCLAILRVGGG